MLKPGVIADVENRGMKAYCDGNLKKVTRLNDQVFGNANILTKLSISLSALI